MSNEDWITTNEAAEISGYHQDYVRKLLQSGKIDGKKFGVVWQVRRESLEAYLSEIEKRGDKRGPKKSA